jgi:hypothetical protein
MIRVALSKTLCHNIGCLIRSRCELGIEATFWGEAVENRGGRHEARVMNTDIEAWSWV